MTKRYHRLSILFSTLSLLLNIAPLATYAIIAMVESDLVTEKIALCMTVLIVGILTAVSLVNKVAMRSRIWIIFLGLYGALDYIMVPLVIVACCQVLDELLVQPLSKRFKQKYSINKELDKRGI